MSGAPRRVLLVTAVVGFAAVVFARPPASEPSQPTRPSLSPPKFVGVAGCAAMACHGGLRPNERNEYTTWIQHDRHARAFSVLYDERSQRIATNLSLKRSAHEEQICLACHSTATVEQSGPRFAIEDGVSCEACHGAAERWLVPHAQADWKQKSTQEKYSSLGMTNTKDVTVRAGVCVQCHIGGPDREVNHELIAAGHPPLVFELDAYTANMPPHWRETPDKPTTFGAQAWAVGQAVALKQSVELLRLQASGERWPEFAQFECYACHRHLQKQSWRQQAGYGDRRPGSPAWSAPQWLTAQRLIGSTGKKPPGSDEFAALQALLARSNAPAPDVAAAAEKAAAVAAQVVELVKQEKWDIARLRTLLADLAADPGAASLDYATAAHITMALGALFEATVRADSAAGSTASWGQKVRPHLDRLYDCLQQPAAFDGSRFVQDLRAFRQSL